MAIDYAADNIRVVPLVVGGVDTEMSRQHALAQGLSPDCAEPGSSKLGRMAEQAEVARVIAFLASPEASFMTGSPVIADGGMLCGCDPPAGRPRRPSMPPSTMAGQPVMKLASGEARNAITRATSAGSAIHPSLLLPGSAQSGDRPWASACCLDISVSTLPAAIDTARMLSAA